MLDTTPRAVDDGGDHGGDDGGGDDTDGNSDGGGGKAPCPAPDLHLQWIDEKLVSAIGRKTFQQETWQEREHQPGRAYVAPARLPVTPESALAALAEAFKSVGAVIDDIIKELKLRFPENELMKAMAMVQPRYWELHSCVDLSALVFNINANYSQQLQGSHASMIKPALLVSQAPEFGSFMAQHSRAFNGKDASGAQRTPPEAMEALWAEVLEEKGTFYARGSTAFPEWCKLARIYMCIPVSSVDCERRFVSAKYLKSAVRNSLGPKHLNTCVRTRACQHYTVKTFPHILALGKWANAAVRRNKKKRSHAEMAAAIAWGTEEKAKAKTKADEDMQEALAMVAKQQAEAQLAAAAVAAAHVGDGDDCGADAAPLTPMDPLFLPMEPPAAATVAASALAAVAAAGALAAGGG